MEITNKAIIVKCRKNRDWQRLFRCLYLLFRPRDIYLYFCNCYKIDNNEHKSVGEHSILIKARGFHYLKNNITKEKTKKSDAGTMAFVNFTYTMFYSTRILSVTSFIASMLPSHNLVLQHDYVESFGGQCFV